MAERKKSQIQLNVLFFFPQFHCKIGVESCVAQGMDDRFNPERLLGY